MSTWHTGNRYLSLSETKENAKIVAQFLLNRFWSKNAISAVLGNMQGESGINPGIWESLDPFNGGYGLVQWTPYTKYSDWCISQGVYDWQDNGDMELKRIIYEAENGLQWMQVHPMTFEEFIKSNQSITLLTAVWLYNYERPADPEATLPIRVNYAKILYDEIVKNLINPSLLALARKHKIYFGVVKHGR